MHPVISNSLSSSGMAVISLDLLSTLPDREPSDNWKPRHSASVYQFDRHCGRRTDVGFYHQSQSLVPKASGKAFYPLAASIGGVGQDERRLEQTYHVRNTIRQIEKLFEPFFRLSEGFQLSAPPITARIAIATMSISLCNLVRFTLRVFKLAEVLKDAGFEVAHVWQERGGT